MSEDVRQGGQNELQFRIVAVEVLSCEEGETVLCEHQVIQPWLVSWPSCVGVCMDFLKCFFVGSATRGKLVANEKSRRLVLMEIPQDPFSLLASVHPLDSVRVESRQLT